MSTSTQSQTQSQTQIKDPGYAEFFAWMTPKEKEAHIIAVRMLGTSYDWQKTHAHTKYLAATKPKIEGRRNHVE